MSWTDYFINNDKKETTTTENKIDSKKETTKFPSAEKTSNNSIQTNFSQSGQVSDELASKFFDAYESAFDKMNQDGYDFFEFFQAVMHGDINNPQTYAMAFGMGKAMDKTLSKDKLLTQSEFYISQLIDLYNKNTSEGTQKKQDLINAKENENRNLNSELGSLRQQLEGLQIQIQDREKKLSLVDSKYEPQITERDSKLMANEYAKNKIISTIETVKQGINQNLK